MSRVRLLALAGAVIVISGVAWGPGVALAQDPNAAGDPAGSAGSPAAPVDLEKARAHYRNAEVAMASGEYARAAREYQAALAASQDPVLYYKIGDAHERAGDCQKALDSYRAYLDQGKPDEQFRSMTEQRIARCTAILVGQDTEQNTGQGTGQGSDQGIGDSAGASAGATGGSGAQSGDGAGTQVTDGDGPPEIGSGMGAGSGDALPSFADSSGSWQRDAGWIAIGVAVALTSTGGVLAVSANSREEDLQNLIDFRDILTGEPQDFAGNTRARYEELIQEGEDLNTYSTIAFVAAGAAVASAVTFFILDARSGRSGGGPEIIAGARDSRPGVQIVPRVGTPEDGIGASALWKF